MGFEGITAKIPLGQYGILTDMPSDKLPPNALDHASNVCFFNGSVQKAPGTLKWNATPLSSGIIALWDYWPTSDAQRTIAVTSDGKVYRDIGSRDFSNGTATFSPITTGLGTLTPNCMFAEGGQESANRDKKLFFFSYGQNPIKVLAGDGITFRNITGPSADWSNVFTYPRVGIIHRDRLWVFFNQQYYASDSADHENFLSNFLADAIFPGEGGAIRGAFDWKGRLFVFKDGGFVYWLNDGDTDENNWYWQKLASNFGLSAPHAALDIIDDMIAGNTSGSVTSYSATNNLSGVEGADILKNLQMENFHRANTSDSGLMQQHAIYYEKKKLAFFTWRSGYYTYNDTLLVLDYNAETPRPAYWRKGSPQCLAKRKDVNQILRPMYGDKDGYIHIMDYEDRLEGGAAFTGEFQTAHIDFSYLDPKLSTFDKMFCWLSVTFVPEGSHNLSCDYFIDGKYMDTVQFQMNQFLRPQLNTLTLNTDRLRQANTESEPRRLRGSGRTFSARFYNSGSNQSFQVSSITVGFKLGTNKAQKAV